MDDRCGRVRELAWLFDFNVLWLFNSESFKLKKKTNFKIITKKYFLRAVQNLLIRFVINSPLLQTYHKLTYTGLLLNFKSFASFSYKISLIKCVVDRSFKICNNWNSFHNGIENIKSNHIKNAFVSFLIDKVIKKYLDYKFSSNQN